MKNISLLLLSLFCLSGLFACETTQVNSVKDPLFFNGKQIKSIAVYAKNENLNERIEMESTFVNEISNSNYDVNILKTTDIMPPLREYSLQEIKIIMKNNNVDAVLFLEITKSGNKIVQIDNNQPYKTKGTYKYNKSTRRGEYDSVTTGGNETYNVKKPYISISATLIDPVNNVNIWISNADARGNAFSSISGVTNEAITSIIYKMEEDKIIQMK